MNIVPGNRDENLSLATEAIERAAERGAHLVVLPEMFTTPFDYEYIYSIAEPVPGGDTIKTLADIAAKRNLYLVAGSIPEQGEGGVYNCSVLISTEGEILGRYRKTHLFPLMYEDTHLTPGDTITTFPTPLGEVGINICYDIRFPEVARATVLEGAELLVVPAQFPYPRLDHWRTLLRARAIENQCFVIAVNRVGKFNHTRFCGHSSIYDPWGNLLAGSGDEEALVEAEIDIHQVEQVRSSMECFNNRRTDLY